MLINCRVVFNEISFFFYSMPFHCNYLWDHEFISPVTIRQQLPDSILIQIKNIKVNYFIIIK